jgi:hypothetical protein
MKPGHNEPASRVAVQTRIQNFAHTNHPHINPETHQNRCGATVYAPTDTPRGTTGNTILEERTVTAALLLEYRCRARGCLLLKVWQTPNGPEFFAPGRGLSRRYAWVRRAELDILDDGDGRQQHGEDGGDHVGRLDDLHPWLSSIPLACGHVHLTAWTWNIREDIAGRKPGQPARILWPLADMDGS